MVCGCNIWDAGGDPDHGLCPVHWTEQWYRNHQSCDIEPTSRNGAADREDDMTTYNTATKTIGDITVTVSKAKSGSAGDRLIAFLEWLGGPHPDQGLPGSGGYPDQGLPGGSGGKPDQGLPGTPDNSLPGGSGGSPDNSLPGSQPGPDNSLPGSQPGPDQGLPGSQPGVDNTLPGIIAANAKEIAKAILKGTACDMDKPQPK
jgi:hypothetical protein